MSTSSSSPAGTDRARRGAAVVSLAGVMALGGAVASGLPTAAVPAAVATRTSTAPPPALTVHSVRLNRSRVAVSGLNTMPVRITVSASFPTPAQGGDDRTDLTAILTRSPKTVWPALTGTGVPLKRVGTEQTPGIWTGVANLPSTMGGSLTVTAISPAPAHIDTGGQDVPVPVNGPTVQVTGVHVPAVTRWVVPRKPAGTVRRYRIAGQVIDTATKAPYGSRVAVHLVIDGTCQPVAPCQVRTDTRGRFTFAVRNTPIGTPPSRPVRWGHNVLLYGASVDALRYPTLILIAPVAMR